MRSLNWMASILSLVLLAGGVLAEDAKVPVDKLPKAVVAAVKAKFPKAELKEAEKEIENGKTIFEITVKDGDAKIDVNVTEAGNITGYEKEIPLKDLPKVVSDTVRTKHAKGAATMAEAVYQVHDGKDTLAYYEVTVEVDGKKFELEILPNGQEKPELKK